VAAQLITLPYRPVINLLGGIEAGAELDVFLSGSTTRVEIYSDADLTVELENPLEADSAGRFPPVYYDDTSAVRFRLRANNNTVLADVDPYLPDFATTEAARDAAAASAAASLASENNAEGAVLAAAAQVDLAEAAAVVAQAFAGPLYANTTLGLAATTNGQGFRVGTVSSATNAVYLNDAGTAVFVRTIIVDSADPGTAALIGTTGGNLQAVLDAIGGAATIDLTADVTGVLPVANGGTGGSTAGTARTALGAAASGANADITSLRQSTSVAASGAISPSGIGFRGLPKSSQATGSTITLSLDDSGKRVPNTLGGWAIPSNATLAFPEDTAILVQNTSSSSQTITITSDTLRLSGTASTGTRTVLQRGTCLLVKVGTTEWWASGDIT
jgi:hypothetical protein